MTHVFISYSKKNRAYARTLADHLLSVGFDVWIDDRIDYGEMWERTIFKAIDDCSAFLVIMTPESYESDWVLREIQYADRRRKPQFPVLLDGEDFPRYGPHQHVDVRGGHLPPEDFYGRLEKAAPRRAKTGTNVTPQDVAVPQTDTLPATPAAPITASTRNLNTRVIAAIAVGIFVLLIIGLVLLNRPTKTEEKVNTLVAETATLRQEITQLSTVLTPEATQQIVSVPSLTITHTSTQPPSKTSTITQTAAPSPSRTPTATLTRTATFTRTPTETPTIDIAMAVNTLDAEATIHVHETNQAATATEHAARTATAASWTDTPTPTATLTPNITASIEAFLTQRAAQTETAIAAFQTATADSWTETPTPTPTFTNTPTSTPTPTYTFTPTPTPTALGGGTGQIGFNSNRGGIGQIYAMDVNGSHIRRITTNATDHNDHSWSPDGSQIAFDSYLDGNYEIYVINSDGTNLKRLTQNSTIDSDPAWSPDGQQIAFRSSRDGNPEIYTMNADGSNPQNLTKTNNNRSDYQPAWSPNGRQIVFYSNRDGNYEIYTMNENGSNPHNLTNNNANDTQPAWSPDGQQIAFRSNRDGNFEIYIMNADGSNQHNLTNNNNEDSSPAWSPDGRQIAFRSNRDGNFEIYVMNADGSNQHNISNNPAADVDPSWRPAAPNPDPLLNVPVIDNGQSTSTLTFTPNPTIKPATLIPQSGNVTRTATPTKLTIKIVSGVRVNLRREPNQESIVDFIAEPNTEWTASKMSTDEKWVLISLGNGFYHGWVSIQFISPVSGNLYALPRGNN